MSAPKRIREIIGLLGHQGVGKNYIAEKILPEILIKSRNTVVLAFADHLKIECISKLGADFDKVYGEKDYETRKLLQITGTEEGRDKYGKDVWIKTLENWIKVLNSRGVERFIISDVRFANEAEWVKSMGGTVIKISSPQRYQARLMKESSKGGNSGKSLEQRMKELMEHPSEKEIDTVKTFDFEIKNDPGDNPREELARKMIKFHPFPCGLSEQKFMLRGIKRRESYIKSLKVGN